MFANGIVEFNSDVLGMGSDYTILWDFGDGSTSTDFNPSHTYTSFGDFTINLIATGPLGSDTIIKSQHISILPSNPCIYSMPLNSY